MIPLRSVLIPPSMRLTENILHIQDQEYIYQEEDYCWFYKEMFKLKIKALDMHTSEILRLCEEIEEIAPKTVNL